MPTAEKRTWTRREYDWLLNQGTVLYSVAKTHSNYGPKNEEGRAWLQQIEAWMEAGLPADQRAAIDKASFRLRGLFLRRELGTMDGPAFVEGTLETVEALKASAGGYRFAHEVSDADFLEFLRAAAHEDAKLSMGKALTVDAVGSRAGLDSGTAAACVRRAFGESLMYRHGGDPETDLYLEHDDVDYAITRMERVSGVRTSVRVAATKGTLTLDVSGAHSAGVREVLEKNASELSIAEANGLHMAGIVLSGSIGEGLLYDALLADKPRAMAAAVAPKVRGASKDLETGRWTLADYINVAAELGMLAATTQKMAHDVLRDFRNMIHPKLQIELDLRPGASELKASVAWLEAVARDLQLYRAAKKP